MSQRVELVNSPDLDGLGRALAGLLISCLLATNENCLGLAAEAVEVDTPTSPREERTMFSISHCISHCAPDLNTASSDRVVGAQAHPGAVTPGDTR